MRKLNLKTLALAWLASVLVCGSAAAQTGTILTADIPFSFTVNNTTLPAGNYELQEIEPWEFYIHNASKGIKLIFSTDPISSGVNAPKAYELEFSSFGDNYFLSKIWYESTTWGFYVPKSKSERALIKTGEMKIHKVTGKKK